VDEAAPELVEETEPQTLLNALTAALTVPEAQILLISDLTSEALEPQMVGRSAGLGWVLIAARRQAGGVAATKLAETAKRAKTRVDLANMLKMEG